MKKLIIFTIMLFVFFTANAIGQINEQQVHNLVEAVWKLPPESMDIVYYVTSYNLETTEQELTESYENVFDKMIGPKESLSQNERKRYDNNVRLNVERLMKQKQVGRKIKFRVRYETNKQRVDKVEGLPERTIHKDTKNEEHIAERKIRPDTPYDLSHIEVSGPNNAYLSIYCFHDSKRIQIKQESQRSYFSKSKVPRFMMMPIGSVIPLKTLLGKQADGIYVPDEIKMEQLQLGKLDSVTIDIQQDKEYPEEKVQIEIVFANNESGLFKMLLTCDKNNYSKVYYYEIRSTVTQQLLFTRKCSDYNSQGFPTNIIWIEYDTEGEIKDKEVYKVEHAHVNLPIDNAVFDYKLLESYTVQDYRMSKEQRRLQEVKRWKEMLNNDDKIERARSLKMLQKLLREDSEQMREIAKSMLNDEETVIRKHAAYIIEKIDSNNK